MKNRKGKANHQSVSFAGSICLGENRRSAFRSFTIFIVIMLLPGILTAEKTKSSKDALTPIEYGFPDQSIFVATTDSDNNPDSPMKRLAAILMEKSGIPWKATAYPAKRLFRNLKSGSTNFSILVRASSLKECCLFSKNPVYSTTLNIYTLGDNPLIKSKQELVGKSVITIRGYSYAGLLKFISDPKNNILIHPTGTHQAAFKMLKNRRADYLLDYESAASFILAENPIKNIKSSPISRLDIYLVLSKSYPDAEKTMNKLETIAESLDVPAILKGN